MSKISKQRFDVQQSFKDVQCTSTMHLLEKQSLDSYKKIPLNQHFWPTRRPFPLFIIVIFNSYFAASGLFLGIGDSAGRQFTVESQSEILNYRHFKLVAHQSKASVFDNLWIKLNIQLYFSFTAASTNKSWIACL